MREQLFETNWIKGVELSNRFVRSATWEGMATPEGTVTPKLIETMVGLARGGVGLIVTGHAYVRPEGQASPFQLAIHNDYLLEGLQELTGAVHPCGGKIFLQMAHAGAFAMRQRTGRPPLAVFYIEGLFPLPVEEMTQSLSGKSSTPLPRLPTGLNPLASMESRSTPHMATFLPSFSLQPLTDDRTNMGEVCPIEFGFTSKSSRPSGRSWAKTIPS